jgi:hypothetical protein
MKSERVEFPYKKYKGTERWKRVQRAIRSLVANKDIIEQTPREYIVGFICQELSRGKTKGSR